MRGVDESKGTPTRTDVCAPHLTSWRITFISVKDSGTNRWTERLGNWQGCAVVEAGRQYFRGAAGEAVPEGEVAPPGLSLARIHEVRQRAALSEQLIYPFCTSSCH